MLLESDIQNSIGQWALRLVSCQFDFKIAYVGNMTPNNPYEIDADGYQVPIEIVVSWCEKLSACLRKNKIGYEIIHFNSAQEEVNVYRSAEFFSP